MSIEKPRRRLWPASLTGRGAAASLADRGRTAWRLPGRICPAPTARLRGGSPPPSSSGSVRSDAAAPPDVVVITLDTTRRDHVGVYGYQRGTTPRIDEFAADAVVYENAWSTASWTLPAHASILTGKHPTSHGAHFETGRADAKLADVLGAERAGEVSVNRLGDDAVTMPELLKAAGYATAAFAGGPWLAPPFGLLQGYDEQDAADVTREGGRGAEQLTEHALAWMRRQPRDRPLHVLVNYFDPHWPYEPPAGFDDLPHARDPLDRKYFLGVNRGVMTMPPEQRAIWVDRYDGEIRFMDHHLGRLLDGLRELGRYDDALDHRRRGPRRGVRRARPHRARAVALRGGPARAAHRAQSRGRDGGSFVEAAVSVVDLLPLVAAEVGLTLPADVEGVDPGFRELVLAEEYRDVHAIKALGPRFDRDLFAMIRWPWKLILSDRDAPELYNLATDRAEVMNAFTHRSGIANDMLRTALQARSTLRAPARLEAPRDVTPETRDRLRSLGYVE